VGLRPVVIAATSDARSLRTMGTSQMPGGIAREIVGNSIYQWGLQL
jgi:hypothetical protein